MGLLGPWGPHIPSYTCRPTSSLILMQNIKKTVQQNSIKVEKTSLTTKVAQYCIDQDGHLSCCTKFKEPISKISLLKLHFRASLLLDMPLDFRCGNGRMWSTKFVGVAADHDVPATTVVLLMVGRVDCGPLVILLMFVVLMVVVLVVLHL